jgi:branched-chain amino acid transport system permease protein
MRDFVEIACYFVFALMWNLLAGYGGMVSIGQQAYFGLGGYAMLVLANVTGVNPFPRRAARRVGGRRDLGAGVVRGVPSRGGYFAIGTWVIAEVFRLGVANVSAVGGGSGTSLDGAARNREGHARDGPPMASRSRARWPRSRPSTCSCAASAAWPLLAIRDNEVRPSRRGSTCAA